MKETLTIADIQRLTGHTFKTIKPRLDGLKPIKVVGKSIHYDSKKALYAVIYPVNETSPIDVNVERAKLASAQTKKIEVETKKLLETLVDKEEHAKEFQGHLKAFSNRLLAMSHTITDKVHQEKDVDKIFEIIDTSVKQALTELSKNVLEEE